MKTNYPVDKFTLPDGQEINITFFAHSSLGFKICGKTIYVDPLMTSADYSQLPKADLILITHHHPDHLDIKAVEAVSKSSTLIISTPTVIDTLKLGTALQNGESTMYNNIKITAYPAYNTTQGREEFHPKGRDNGYLLEVENQTIYIAGDTEIVDVDDKIKNCSFLFLPIDQPFTMTVAQAKHWADLINPGLFYPYHTSETPIEDIKNAFINAPYKVAIHPMP